MTDDISGKAKGGFARAESLSQGNVAVAKKGAMARWNPAGIPRAEYTGNLKIRDMSFPMFRIVGWHQDSTK